MNTENKKFGVEDNSYNAAGGLTGLTALVYSFYEHMDSLPEARSIREMHPSDLAESRKKLAYFLSGWLGGPKLYSKNFGSTTMPKAHRHLPIGRAEVESWMLCMKKAVDKQPYEESFKVYLIEQLRVPAERIFSACNI